MACPHVSGVAALVLSRFGKEDYFPEDLKERLLRSVSELDQLQPTYEQKMGYGLLNAAEALRGTPPEINQILDPIIVNLSENKNIDLSLIFIDAENDPL
jgi:subtilisin family serine protease